MFDCSSCGAKHTDGTVCSVCKLHFDFGCSGITETGYRRLGDRKNLWRCPKCKSSPAPSPSIAPTSPLPSSSQLDKMQEQLNNILFQLTPLTSLLEDVKSIKAELHSVTDSLNMAHELINKFSGTVKTLESRIVKVEKAASEVVVLQEQVTKLTRDIEEREQWSRSNNVEIRGIPQKNTENLFDIAANIGKLCEFPISKEQINYITRVPTRVPNATKSIIVAFNNRYIKEEFIAKSRKCKHLNASNMGYSTSSIIYVNDHLTQHNKMLLTRAKALARENNFRYVWVKHCKILLRKSDTSPILTVKSEKDLTKII